jgi:hypothetical protein
MATAGDGNHGNTLVESKNNATTSNNNNNNQNDEHVVVDQALRDDHEGAVKDDNVGMRSSPSSSRVESSADRSKHPSHNLTSNEHSKPSLHVSEQSAQHQTETNVNVAPTLQQKRHIERMIQRGIDAGKDIDKKTIKSLSEEIQLLTDSIKEKDAAIVASAIPYTPAPLEDVTLLPASDRQKLTKSIEHQHKTDMMQREVQQLKSALEKVRDTQKPHSAYQIHLLYSFLLGGIAVLIFSTFITWMYGVVFD